MDAVSDAAVRGDLTAEAGSKIASEAEETFIRLMIGEPVTFGSYSVTIADPGFLGKAIENSIKTVIDLLEARERAIN